MKNLILWLSAILFTVTLTAQDFQQSMLPLKSINSKQMRIQQLVSELRLDPFKLCGETFSWDTLENEFVYAGDVNYSYQEIGGIKKMTIENLVVEEGETFDVKIEYYASWQQDPEEFLANFGDSIYIYFGDGAGNYELFSKTINHFDNQVLEWDEEYTDFSLFGFPLGFVKSAESHYYYDGNGFLVTKVTDGFSFLTNMLEFSDSITYENNNLGHPIIEIGYQADFFSGLIEPYYKDEYKYVNQHYVSEDLNYLFDGLDWFKNSRTTTSYNGNNLITLTLNEITVDDGATWINNNRTQFLYEEEFPLPLPSRQLIQEFVNGAWRNQTLSLLEDCTSRVIDLPSVDLDVWVSGDRLYLCGDVVGKNALLTLSDLSGRKWIETTFDRLPESIVLRDLPGGVYVVRVVSPQGIAVQKFFK